MTPRFVRLALLIGLALTNVVAAEPTRNVRNEPAAEKKTTPRQVNRPSNNNRPAEGGDVSSAVSRLAVSPARTVIFTEEREAAARTFVRNNRPEMEAVLDQLRTSKPDEYRQVIGDLFRTVESFTVVRQDDPQRYELLLQEWRTEAKTHLLAAELVAKPAERERVTRELRAVIEELADLRVRAADHELRRLEANLRRAEGQRKKLESTRNDFVTERMDAILQAVGRVEGASKEAAPSKR